MSSKKPDANSESAEELREAFRRDGFLPPFPLFTRAQCNLVQAHIRWGDPPAPSKWMKGRAVTDKLIFDLATRPALLARVRLLLGDDIVLWGASWVTRQPKQVHPWHCDSESSAPEGGFVSVWIGIENTCRESALQLICGSHRIGKTIQQFAHEHGFRRGEAGAATALTWAREIISSAEFVQPQMSDGDALVFDGRLWHASENTCMKGTRTALLFQYAITGKSIKMPDWDHLEWPFRYEPTCAPLLLISGMDGANRIVAPPGEEVAALPPQFHQISLPSGKDGMVRWKPHPLFVGETPNVARIAAHYSFLLPGHSPHPPHAHREEEILIVIDGDAEVVIGQNDNENQPRCERLRRGSFLYYPAFQFHTIRNVSSKPVTYLMFKWVGQPCEVETPLETVIVRTEAISAEADHPFHFLFEGPTHYLTKLQAHLTHLLPEEGYKAHADLHDVAIVTLSGSVRTAGRRLKPNNVIYFPAGELHGMDNPGPELAHYLVFEFDGTRPAEGGRLRSRARPIWQERIHRVYRRLRQKAAATSLWKRARPIYRKFRSRFF
jgi:Protein involved in biosynthesis of mitomycin antibiotics/polyketide fumonisin